MIDFELVTMTPDMAKNLLDRNYAGNRKIQPARVSAYLSDMEDGNWQLTHQCIAVNEEGELIDGQHRLTALVESGGSFPMYVATYKDSMDKFRLFDIGAKRSVTDVLGCDKRDQETARILWHTCATNKRTATASEIANILQQCGADISATSMAACGSRKARASAPVRAAFVMAMHLYPKEKKQLCKQLAAFSALDAAVMWPSLLRVVKRFDQSTANTWVYYRNQVLSALLTENRDKDMFFVHDAVNTTARNITRSLFGDLNESVKQA